MRSRSSSESSFGLTTTPPFAPPNGSPIKAHFQVIHMASAVVHPRRDGDGHGLLALQEDVEHVLAHVDQTGDMPQLALGHLPRVLLQVRRRCLECGHERSFMRKTVWTVEGGVPSSAPTGCARSLRTYVPAGKILPLGPRPVRPTA